MCSCRSLLFWLFPLVIVGAVTCRPVLAFAGPTEQEVAKHAPSGAAHKEESPPVFPWAPELFIWTLCVFLILLFVLTRYAWRPMLAALHKREETIRSAVEEAKVARADMERLKQDFEARMAEANAQIPKMMAEARQHAEELAAEMRSRASADIQADRQRLRREIDTARDQALQELWNQTAHLATLISAKALRRIVNEEDHRRLVDEALAELRQAGSEKRRAGAGA
jgi:F-type H+-transporting ATPase subunit b